MSVSEYFQNIGEVESVIRPFQNGTGTYFIRFHSFEDAFHALTLEDHTINGYDIYLCHDWYFAEMKNRASLPQISEEVDERLNDDCILMIMQHLDLVDLLHVARFNDRFHLLAGQRKHIRILPSFIAQPIGIMTLNYVLTLFESSLVKLEVSIDSIHAETFGGRSYFLQWAVIYCIQAHVGPQLKIVSLHGFKSKENESLIQFLQYNLIPRGVDVILL